MKRFVNFVGYLAAILVALLGAYIVFHTWQLSERFRHKESPGVRQTERMRAGKAQSEADVHPDEVKTTTSPWPHRREGQA